MQAAANEDEMGRAEARLRLALDAPRATFLAQFNLLSDGVKFLVDLRSDLLGLLPQDSGARSAARSSSTGCFERWFDPGFLELKRITWQSPALVLEKLMTYEAVHPIASWNDLRNRLDTDRRCYAFFHPRLPDEPLIFVEIALLKGAPEQRADPARRERAGAGPAHRRYRGLLLDLEHAEGPARHQLRQPAAEARDRGPAARSAQAEGVLHAVADARLPQVARRGARRAAGRRCPEQEAAKLAAAIGHPEPERALADALARPDWSTDPRIADALRAPMERFCARYLLREKSGGHPLDPVAQFHLHNGALIDRIYWLADTSARGLQALLRDDGELPLRPRRGGQEPRPLPRSGTIVAAAGHVSRLLD